MSNKALNWAWKVKIDPITHHVLVALADYARTDTKKCWPGIERLQERCNLSKSSVIRSLNKLIKHGLISKQSRYPDKPGRSSNMYILNTKSEGLSVRETPSSLSASVTDLGVSVTHRGGGLGVSVTPYPLDNKQEPLENHKIKEKESIKEKERERENDMYKNCAASVLNYLNEMRPGKEPFKFVDANIDLIISRMKEIVNSDDIDIEEATTFCTRIICHKQREWGTDPEKRNWLRPATLFHKLKFHQYFGELPAEDYYE